MRFSFWPNARQSWTDVLALAQRAERTGWDGVWYADHFMPNTEDARGPCNEAWSTIAALAATVPRIRIGPMVAGNTYRHPAVTANIAATIDRICDGRLVLGLGAGWQENEHRAYGLEFHTVGIRLKMLDEACEVITRLLRDDRSSFEGRFYRLEDAPLEPKPVQSPLPLMIGGGGEKVTLRIVAKHANEWNTWGDIDTMKHKMSILDRHCEALDRDPASIERSSAVQVYLSDDAALVRRIREEPQDRASIAGNVEQMREIVRGYADAGVDEIIVPDFHLPSGAGTEKTDLMDRFIEEVAPVAR